MVVWLYVSLQHFRAGCARCKILLKLSPTQKTMDFWSFLEGQCYREFAGFWIKLLNILLIILVHVPLLTHKIFLEQ